MNSKKRLALYLLLSLSTSSLLYESFYSLQNILDSSHKEDDCDVDNAKIICEFHNYENINSNDVISVVDEDDVIVTILSLDVLKNDNSTIIYLPKGNYYLCSSLGIDKQIEIDDIDDTYRLSFNYNNSSIVLDKMVDYDNKYLSENSEYDFFNNKISSDMNFSSKKIESDNLDYSNIKEDGFESQGYVIIDGTNPAILISSYSNSENSRIYIYDRESGLYKGYIILNNNDHLGGMTYDPNNDILFLTSNNGLINSYNYSLIMESIKNTDSKEVIVDLSNNYSSINNKAVFIKNDINVYQTAATICYYDGNLYSIDYGINSILVKTNYDVVNGEVVSLSNEVIIPEDAKCVQGMAFYEKEDKTYLVLSSSAGILQSKLSVYQTNNNYEWDLENERILKNNKKMEGISVDKYGLISSIYEGSITRSRLISNVDSIINNKMPADYSNELCYYINGFYWDMTHSDKLTLRKAKKMIKKQTT